jgi:(1->4)-alpha-D-glucan 1-alpha-D-glucosylmutase
VVGEPVIPRATYRVQLHKDFGFDRAAELAPYLARLGLSHLYTSPWLKARPGSQHGYDIVDHHALNPELGDEEAFHRMAATLDSHGLRQILDFVPNHMGVGGADNPLWLDVLEWGPDSFYAGWFDIDWQRNMEYLHDKLLAPFLGDQYGVELYSGKLVLRFDQRDGSFAVWAYDTHKLPICPLHYDRILGSAHPDLERLGDEFANLLEWRPQVVRRAREIKNQLAELARNSFDVRDAIAFALKQLNGTPGVEVSWNKLHDLIEDQRWRVAYFRVAADDINYRRFFNINDLAGLRMELPEVFEHAHALVFRLLENGIIDGLRIDHVDGLLDPQEYLQRIRKARNWEERLGSFYLVVEKILARHEGLRENWPVDGTTGYEFANLVLGLLIDPAGEKGFTQTYASFTGARTDFIEMVRDSKHSIMRNEMVSELNVLGRDAARIAQQNPRTADFTQNILRRAIREVVACFPVYRTYVDSNGTPTEEDRRDLDWAMKQARAHDVEIDPSVFDFVHRLLSGDLVTDGHSGFSRHAVLHFAMKVQQYSGPVMAKGLEDTAFYRYNRFVALNEVGGSPEQFGVHLSAFHKANTGRAKRWPNCMLATSTHDAKRGEDTRARLAALSELPDEWARAVQGWSRVLRARRAEIEATAPPDRNDEYLFYQLLVGTWPAELTGAGSLDADVLKQYKERLKLTMTKSMREAKLNSTWAAPNTGYEDAVLAFVEDALDTDRSRAFLNSFRPFQERIARLGIRNSLVQTTLKLTAPGVPDIYQGAEFWDLSMVDPDNRRPVDYARRIQLLEQVTCPDVTPEKIAAWLKNWQDSAIKLHFISAILQFRRENAELFERGGYEPLIANGPKADQICAFARRLGKSQVVVATARFPARFEADPSWPGTSLAMPSPSAGEKWREILTQREIEIHGGVLPADQAFAYLPAALLVAA